MSTLRDVQQQLGALSSQARETIAVLRAEWEEVGEHVDRLESARAAREYLDFFIERFTVLASELERISALIAETAGPADVAALRQLAQDASADEWRCLDFRDVWISTRLPHEQIHQLLDRISFDTYDQLLTYRRLVQIAGRLEPTIPHGPMDRRALFNMLFKR